MKRRRPRVNRSDERAMEVIAEAGFDLTRIRAEDHGRFVARQRVIEDDHSITWRWESSYTLEGLAKNVQRRVRETT